MADTSKSMMFLKPFSAEKLRIIKELCIPPIGEPFNIKKVMEREKLYLQKMKKAGLVKCDSSSESSSDSSTESSDSLDSSTESSDSLSELSESSFDIESDESDNEKEYKKFQEFKQFINNLKNQQRSKSAYDV
jgi:hypothetical protein